MLKVYQFISANILTEQPCTNSFQSHETVLNAMETWHIEVNSTTPSIHVENVITTTSSRVDTLDTHPMMDDADTVAHDKCTPEPNRRFK